MEKNFFTIFLKKSNNIEEFSIFFYLKKYFYFFFISLFNRNTILLLHYIHNLKCKRINIVILFTLISLKNLFQEIKI